MTHNLKPVDVHTLQSGTSFPVPLFFDDGAHLFAAKGQSINSFHLRAVKNWNLEILLAPEESQPEEAADLEELEDLEEL
jgi:hypothetical protein